MEAFGLPKLSPLKRMKDIELRLVTTWEMAALVGVTTRTIQNWVRVGIISHIKIGRLIRFNPKRVLQDLEVYECPAKPYRQETPSAPGPTQNHEQGEPVHSDDSELCREKSENDDQRKVTSGAKGS